MDKRRITERTMDELKQESEWSQVKNTITSTSNYYEDIFKRPIICLPKKWQIL